VLLDTCGAVVLCFLLFLAMHWIEARKSREIRRHKQISAL
jgi:hypothetical protein